MLLDTPMFGRRTSLLIALLLVGVTLYLSFSDDASLMGIPNGDKYGHFLAYFVLMIWFGLIYPAISSFIITAALLSMMGIGIEFLQELSATRAFEVGDAAAGIGGVLVAMVLLLAGSRRFSWHIVAETQSSNGGAGGCPRAPVAVSSENTELH